ncbi:substrate-binding domain-containing protein [Phreatobacter sp.]|uniref:substrate-binding domain-containing protein n=1 Tax=Phreatobacter sp. TaxID=1966341 RepID=UPI003F6EB7B6
MPSPDRRRLLLAGGLAGLASVAAPRLGRADRPFQFGLTPVFLTSDLVLLEALQAYLTRAIGSEVRLVLKRTYQEITSQLVAGQIDAAWICGFPFVAYRSRLDLVAVPIWRGRTTYQSYLIAALGRQASTVDDLKGDVHAFSDPDSNSGFLVTRALLAERNVRPEAFFSRSFFTYGHRNVVRAVAAGLAQSGSVDGYVWEVMTETEPELTTRTRVVWRSDWMGFPPVATSAGNLRDERVARLQTGLRNMAADPLGQRVLGLLRLDGFALADADLFRSIAHRVALVGRE